MLDEPLPLGELIDADGFAAVCRSLSTLFGIGVRVFSADGRKIVDVRAGTGDHCGYLFTVHKTRVLCTNLVGHIKRCDLASRDANVPEQIDCFSGLRYQILPIVYEGSLVGRVIFGPYAPAGLENPPSTLQELAPELNRETLGNFLARIPRASEEAVEKILESIRSILEVIIHTTYKSALASKVHIASISGAFADLEKTSRDLQLANDRLQELDRLKSNFVATISHELRTPLTSIIGYSEMLLEGMAGSVSDEQERYIRTILEKGESLLSLIGQILDLARIESGNVVLRKAPVHPRHFVEAAVSDVLPQARKRELTVRQSISPDVRVISVDSDKVRRVLNNLLSNAVKFTPKGGTVSVQAEMAEAAAVGSDWFDVFEPERNQYLRLVVQDTGIGVAADKIDQIFESFYQVDNSSTREFGGSGLGLSIVRNFVRAHGGKILVDSSEGQGSTFTILLPYSAGSPLTAPGIDGVEPPHTRHGDGVPNPNP